MRKAVSSLDPSWTFLGNHWADSISGWQWSLISQLKCINPPAQLSLQHWHRTYPHSNNFNQGENCGWMRSWIIQYSIIFCFSPPLVAQPPQRQRFVKRYPGVIPVPSQFILRGLQGYFERVNTAIMFIITGECTLLRPGANSDTSSSSTSSLEQGWELTLSPVTAVGSTSSTPSLHPRSDRINIRSYFINKRKIVICFSLFYCRRLNFLSSISNFDSFSSEVRLCQTRDICKRSSEPLFQLKDKWIWMEEYEIG